LKKDFGVNAELVPGKGGEFEVLVDGDNVFSKEELGRFPEPGEVTSRIKKQKP
jgi:selenoprotein W-related protein